MSEEMVDLEIKPSEEIARLKDLVSFTTREAGTCSARVEVTFRKDQQSVCVTAPAMNEERIARLVIPYVLAVWRDATDERLQTRVCEAIQPVVNAIQNCKHLDDGEGVCMACISDALRGLGEIVNRNVPPEDTDAPQATPMTALCEVCGRVMSALDVRLSDGSCGRMACYRLGYNRALAERDEARAYAARMDAAHDSAAAFAMEMRQWSARWKRAAKGMRGAQVNDSQEEAHAAVQEEAGGDRGGAAHVEDVERGVRLPRDGDQQREPGAPIGDRVGPVRGDGSVHRADDPDVGGSAHSASRGLDHQGREGRVLPVQAGDLRGDVRAGVDAKPAAESVGGTDRKTPALIKAEKEAATVRTRVECAGTIAGPSVKLDTMGPPQSEVLTVWAKLCREQEHVAGDPIGALALALDAARLDGAKKMRELAAKKLEVMDPRDTFTREVATWLKSFAKRIRLIDLREIGKGT
jgi:hypothetical protein